MIALIDTIFKPVLAWLAMIKSHINSLSVPLSRPLEVSDYLGPLALFGPYWLTFVTTAFVFGFIFVTVYVIMSLSGLLIKFKDTIKWW